MKRTIFTKFALTSLVILSAVSPVFATGETVAVEVVKEAVQVAPSIWSAVQDNTVSTISNIIAATRNAVSQIVNYAPYVLNQVAKETNAITGSLKDAPVTTTALLALAGYGMYKTWNWVNANRGQWAVHITEQGQVVRNWVVNRQANGNNQ